MGLGRPDPAVELLRELFTRRDWRLADERLDKLRQEAAAWDLPGHHGLVALQTDREFLSGPGFRRERYHAAILVRRRAAARKYRHVTVPMVPFAGGLIESAACIRRADGRLEPLDDDRFTVGSAEDDNPFIAVARRQTGIWILPDLAPGDVVEYVWETVRLGRHDGPRHSHFVLANVADPETPTLRARVSFTAPPAWELAFAVRNTGPGRETAAAAHGWPTTVFPRARILPRRSHSHHYQDELLNPVVACAPAGATWDEVARDLLSPACAAAEAPLPGPLADLCAAGGTPREALARAFYWIRDHIKYASVASANRDLDHPERAARVLAAGMGDCKDVSLLLALVCRELGVPWEFVLMSTAHGIVLDELPADQFDHVLVRARPDDEWLYLDAAGARGIFTAAPAPAQGLTALAGRDGGALVTIPESPPAATRVVVDEVYDRVEDGWLAGHMELHLHGHPARLLDEAWKHFSLVAVDPERAADDALHQVLPECQVDTVERLCDTAGGDELRMVAHGRRAPLMSLDGHRIAALGVQVPGLPHLGGRQPRLREPFQFPLAMEVEWRVSATGEVGRLLRAVSRVPDLVTPSCTVADGPAAGPTVVRRRLRLGRRTVAGEELASLPAALRALDEACRLVISLEDDPA
jgi:transglutaminase-like putative cysteine protease